jgi:16S rRNA (guanine527-N7)-methyltransferase
MASGEAQAAAKSYAEFLARPVAEVAEDLESLSVLLRKWNAVQNLVSRETESMLWSRHIVDSLQVLPLLRPADSNFIDLGSGGGFPALPLAIALKGSPAQFRLVEPTTKKAAYLRTVIRELQLPAVVDVRRAEEIDSRETGSIDVVTSRALAALPMLCGLAAPFFGPETRAIFHKGREHVEELRETRLAWDVDVLLTNSVTDKAGVLLQLSNLRLKSVS